VHALKLLLVPKHKTQLKVVYDKTSLLKSLYNLSRLTRVAAYNNVHYVDKIKSQMVNRVLLTECVDVFIVNLSKVHGF